MVRKLAWLFVAALIIADVVLIATMVHSPGSASKTARASGAAGFPAPEMVTPTRSNGSRLPAGNGSGAPVTAAGSAPAGVGLPAPTSGDIQVLGVSREEDAPEPAAAPGAGFQDQDILLQVGADGVIIRAARGSCPSTAPAALSVSRDFGVTWNPVPEMVSQVLALGAPDTGPIWFVGSDTSCRPLERESADGGDSWRTGSVAGRWYLNPDPESTDVAAPSLISDAGCVPRALADVDARRAAVLCADGDIRVTADSGGTWSTTASLPGAVSLTFASADRGFALAGDGECAAAVLRTDDGGTTWSQQACLGDRGPRAVAAAADLVVVQTGSGLFVSRDAGRTWDPAAG